MCQISFSDLIAATDGAKNNLKCQFLVSKNNFKIKVVLFNNYDFWAPKLFFIKLHKTFFKYSILKFIRINSIQFIDGKILKICKYSFAFRLK